MGRDPLFEQLMETTRGRVLALLRRGEKTVSALGDELDLTNNAVRRHLVRLEREELVEEAGRIRDGVGKPARIYRLTPAARASFPRPYGVVLDRVLEVVKERTSSEDVRSILEEIGEELAREQLRDGFPADGSMETRVRAAGELLAGLGGDAEIVRDGEEILIRGFDCPLGRIATAHPESCGLARALLEALLDVEVTEGCDRERPARCRFRVPLEGSLSEPTGSGGPPG